MIGLSMEFRPRGAICYGIIVGTALHLMGCGPNNGFRNSVQSPMSEDKFPVLILPKHSELVSVDGEEFFIERAAVVTVAELKEGNIELYLNNQPIAFLANDFELIPERSELIDSYVSVLNQQILDWGPETDWRRIEFRSEKLDSGVAACQLLVVVKSGRTIRYEYDVYDGDLTLKNSVATGFR